MRLSGKFITVEGIDGSGKSSHIETLSKLIREHGIKLINTREPGGTALGEKLRELLLSEPMSLRTETMLMAAARIEHVETLILPALREGTWVLSDRFSDSTMAFQGGGRGLSIDKLNQLKEWSIGEFQPDLTLLFDIDPEVAFNRISGNRILDRFEKEKRDFHIKVRDAYLDIYYNDLAQFKLGKTKAPRFNKIDSSMKIEDVKKEAIKCILNFIARNKTQ